MYLYLNLIMKMKIEMLNKRKSINLTTNNSDMIPDKIINMRTYKGKDRFLIS